MVDRRRKWRAQNQDIRIKESLEGNRFVVNGDRGIDYVVDVGQPSCECPDWQKRAPEDGCKHILHVKLEKGQIESLPDAKTTFGYSKRRSAKARDENNPDERYSPKWNTLSIRTRKRDDWKCQKCGDEGGPDGDADVEAHHIVPKSKGGKDTLDNLITLCHSCHESEHGHSIPSKDTSNPRSSISSEKNRRPGQLTAGSESTSKESRVSDTRNDSRDTSSANRTSDSRASRVDDASSQSCETTYSTTDREPPLLPPIPVNIKESHYNARGSKVGVFVVGFVVSVIIGALIQMAVSFQIENVVTAVSTGLIYHYGASSINATREKMEKIEEKNAKLESALEEIDEKIESGEELSEQELNRIESEIEEIQSVLDEDVTQYLKDGYVTWIQESEEELSRW